MMLYHKEMSSFNLSVVLQEQSWLIFFLAIAMNPAFQTGFITRCRTEATEFECKTEVWCVSFSKTITPHVNKPRMLGWDDSTLPGAVCPYLQAV